MITLPLRMLAAVAPAMGNKDVRYYLNGVHFEHVQGGVIAVATDGTAVIAARETLPDVEPFASFIMPRETVLELLKAGRKIETFKVRGDLVECDGRGIPFAPIDGKFPDWRAVLPATAQPLEAASFNPDVLEIPLKAAQALKRRGVTRYASVAFEMAGERSARFTLSNLPDGMRVSGVVMPQRMDKVGNPDITAHIAEILRP